MTREDYDNNSQDDEDDDAEYPIIPGWLWWLLAFAAAYVVLSCGSLGYDHMVESVTPRIYSSSSAYDAFVANEERADRGSK